MLMQKSKTKPIGFQKVKGLNEFYIYTSAADGKQELGAKTKGGELFEFHLKQLMQTNEFNELKTYIIKNQ